MSEEQRRHAAIMLTDIVGYTAMTQRNESLSLQLLQAHNEILRASFPRHLGKEIKTIGDAFLVEFEKAEDAFLCALDIQDSLQNYNKTTPSKDMQILVRIGLHYGDVVHQENDVFGNAVNICSRIQPIAQPGGICISEDVYNRVKDSSPLQFRKLPTPEMKNVLNPVEVYEASLPWLNSEASTAASARKTESSAPAGTPSIKQRLAVLPLASIGSDPESDYFADGVTEELINVLSNIRDLRVISRSSVMRYKDSGSRDVQMVGKELNVGSILDGSIRKSGNKIRVSVHVSDVESLEQVWAKNYDYELSDLFAVQSDIAKQVSKALKVKLRSSEKKGIEKKLTESVSAYTLYLNGRFLLNKRTKQAMLEAAKYFESSISHDQKFARAYAGLADSYLLLGSHGYMDTKVAYPKAKEYVSKALELDQSIVEAHISLGFLLEASYYDFAGARSEYEYAISLAPSNSQAHQWYAINLAISRQLTKAIEELEKAKEIDPLSPQIGVLLGGFYSYLGNDESALASWEDVLKHNADNVPVYINRGLFYARKNLKEPALSDMKKALKLAWEPTDAKLMLGYVYALVGEREEALNTLSEVKDRAVREYVSPFYLAVLYLGLGDMELCMEKIEKSIEDKSAEIETIMNDPVFERVRADPRLEGMLNKVGISMRTKESPEALQKEARISN